MSNPVVTNVDGTNAGPNVTSSPSPYLNQGGPQQIGASATSLVAFFGATPVAQQTSPVAVTTDAATSTTNAYGYSTSTQANAIVTAVNTIISDLKTLGLWA